MKLIIKKGVTSKRIAIFVQNSSVTTGAGLAGLVFNSAGLTWTRWREDAGNTGGTAVTLATATRGTFASGGFIEKDATLMPGFYEIGIPDAVLATGASWAVMVLRGATNMAPVTIEIQLVDFDPQSGSNLGLSALPTAAPAAAGGVLTVGTGAGQITPTSGKVTLAEVTHTNAVIPTVTTLTGHTAQTGDSFARLGAPAGASVSVDLAAVKAETNSLDGTKITTARAGNLDNLDASVASRSTLSAAEVNAEVDTALDTAIPGSPTAGSINERVRDLDDALILRRNTAQAGSTSINLVLDSGASATDDFYKNAWVVIVGGPGAGQLRFIWDYDGGTTTASISPAWSTTPDGTSVFVILSAAGVNLEAWRDNQPLTTAAGGRVQANLSAIGLDADAIDEILDEPLAGHTTAGTLGAEIAALGTRPDLPTGAVVDNAGNTASTFETDLASAVDDFYRDAFLQITSDALAGQVRKITAYNGTTKFVTTDAFTAEPSAGGDTPTFVIINS
jgi:hypothetical protein